MLSYRPLLDSWCRNGSVWPLSIFIGEMRVNKKIVIGLMGALLAVSSVVVEAKITSSEKKQVEQIIHNYLISNPEVLIEASQALQKKQQESMVKQANSAIEQNGKELFSSGPMMGNPKGDVTIVEFFDYQCVHCKKMEPIMSALVANDKNLRVLYKEFPIFGKSSNDAALAAIAAEKQGKYQEMHKALLSKKSRLNLASIIKTAQGVGLNTTKLKADMKADDVKKKVNENMRLAEALRLMGTPAFVVASTPNGQFQKGGKAFFIPGAASESSLQEYIKQAQEESKQ